MSTTTLPQNNPIVYVFATQNSFRGQPYVAMIESGEIVDHHYCSNLGWAKIDLGKRLTAYKVIYLENGQLPPKEVLQLAPKYIQEDCSEFQAANNNI